MSHLLSEIDEWIPAISRQKPGLWLVSLLGQPIKGLFFGWKRLQFISQSQIKGDLNFRNNYIRDSSQSKHGNVFFSLSQNFFTKIVYVAYVHDFEGLLFSIFTFLFQLEYFSFVKQKVLVPYPLSSTCRMNNQQCKLLYWTFFVILVSATFCHF